MPPFSLFCTPVESFFTWPKMTSVKIVELIRPYPMPFTVCLWLATFSIYLGGGYPPHPPSVLRLPRPLSVRGLSFSSFDVLIWIWRSNKVMWGQWTFYLITCPEESRGFQNGVLCLPWPAESNDIPYNALESLQELKRSSESRNLSSNFNPIKGILSDGLRSSQHDGAFAKYSLSTISKSLAVLMH